MRNRLPSWVLLLNLAIDFAIFFVPGAFRLSPGTGPVWAEGIFPSREGTSAGTCGGEGPGSAPATVRVDLDSARGRASMADLTEQQKQEYWRYNVTLTTVLLAIWFVVTYLISGLWAGWLNQYTLLGFPLGYYMAAQGSLAIFVIEIAVYAYLMNRKDIEFGIREEG